jgi:O-acetyl-ADP-ribose deacetylase (regulator of RNase III)
MLHYVRGNLFDSPAQAWVNTVNTEGIMGKGIALTFKRLFPAMFCEYQELCESRQLKIGTLHYFRAQNRCIINFPTKTTWRKPSSLKYVEDGLKTFVSSYERYGITSVAFPPLGCGNGELSFERDVRPLMERYLKPLPISVFIYPPQPIAAIPEHRTPEQMEAWVQLESNFRDGEAVWNDVKHLIGAGRKFDSIDGAYAFRATMGTETSYIDEDTMIHVEVVQIELPMMPPGSRALAKSDILAAWEHLRRARVLTAEAFADAVRIGGPALGLLRELPYLSLMKLEVAPDSLSTPSRHALRWDPPESDVPFQGEFSLVD